MEYKKSYFERDVVRSRYNKLRQIIQNAAGKTNTTSQGKNQKKCIKFASNSNTKKCQDINVRETYDEVLDLRNTVLSKESSRNNVRKCVLKKPSHTEPTILNKVCEFPNMHYKIMTLCSVKNSTKFSERFNAKTNMISEKIVNKQLELQAAEKPSAKTKTATTNSRPKFGENTVILNILKKENEFQRKNVVKTPLKVVKSKPETKTSEDKVKIISIPQTAVASSNEDTRKAETQKPRFQLSTKPEAKNSKTNDCFEIAKSRFQRSIMAGMSDKARTSKTKMPTSTSVTDNFDTVSIETKKSNASRGEMKIRSSSSDRSKPRFLLSTKPNRRCAVSHSSIQVNVEKSSTCINTQTEDMIQLKNMSAQTFMKNITNEKKMQTRICKTDTVETGPILIEGPAKYTSTTCDYYHSEQPTQMYQHLTTSDLVCLDWVNRHLFGVNVNPHNFIVDDKIKEVSEVASKSTFLSEMKPLALPR